MHHLQVLAPTQRPARRPQEQDDIAGRAERSSHTPVRMVHYPHHAQYRSGQNRLTVGFVIEADVSARDGNLQLAAGVADAGNRTGELPHDLRPFRVAEVEAVRRADRLRARADDVPGRFRDREHRAAVRVQPAVPSVAVDGKSQSAAGSLDPDDTGAGSRRGDRVGPDHVVVLPVDPAAAGDAG